MLVSQILPILVRHYFNIGKSYFINAGKPYFSMLVRYILPKLAYRHILPVLVRIYCNVWKTNANANANAGKTT
jgi:hypothetical protein